GLSEAIGDKAEELNGTVGNRILPEQSEATAALSANTLPKASIHQTAATTAFAAAEKEFDELLRLIIAKLDAAPPPSAPGPNESLEDLLAMLQDEKKALEGLGIPCRPMNVSIAKDWMKPGSCSNPGASQANAVHAQSG